MLDRVEGMLRGLPLSDIGWGRSILRELLKQTRALETMPPGMVRQCYKALDNNEFPIAKPMDEDGVLMHDPEDDSRFLQARNGGNLVCPFQCDLCHFRNLMSRDPASNLPQDVRLLKLI
jgi:hypothetical protein